MSPRWIEKAPVVLLSLLHVVRAQDLPVINGQILTNGLAIINSPQPDTPMGGDTIEISIEITGDGLLDQPPYQPNFDNGIANLQIYLTSYTTGLNLTISNGTFNGWDGDALDTPEFLCNSTTNKGFQNAGCEDIMSQEGGSSVKHVRWVWPDCMVGNGGANNGGCRFGSPLEDCLDGSARGPYNISFHEAFRINGSEFYTITDLPIQVTNSINQETSLAGTGVRPRCALRNNPLLDPSELMASQRPPSSQPYIGGSVPSRDSGSGNDAFNNGGSSNNNNGDDNGNGNDNSNNDSGNVSSGGFSGSLGSGDDGDDNDDDGNDGGNNVNPGDGTPFGSGSLGNSGSNDDDGINSGNAASRLSFSGFSVWAIVAVAAFGCFV